ncbi:MAG: acyloxyacyl hydrolase [Nitrospirales bacterium]
MFILFVFTCPSGLSWAKGIEVIAIGIRGGMNFQDAGLPPGEKEDFEQFDVFGIVGLPGGWEYESGWQARWRLNGSAGVLRGAGDLGFISTITPGLAFTKTNWNLTLDAGAGGALISDWKFGRQDIGGPFQFIAHGGVSVHLSGNLVTGYRFHHMSDATIYGASRGVDFHMIEFSYHFGDE